LHLQAAGRSVPLTAVWAVRALPGPPTGKGTDGRRTSMGCTNKRLNKTTINVLVSMFIAVGAAASASGIAAAQGSCVQQPDAIICRMPPERPLIVVGQQWEEVNEGTLEATGLQPVGAALWGSGNRLLNAAGARIDAEN